jgi:hypothetical protein
MPSFQTERQAKEHLIGRIVAEARRERVPLSEIERKMLYFTESGWTLPGILEVNAEFERDYDNEEYEQKIAGLVHEIEKQNKAAGGDEQSRWDDAVVKLSEGDHYLLVLIGLGRFPLAGQHSKWLPSFEPAAARPRGDFLRLIVVAFAVLIIAALVASLKDR